MHYANRSLYQYHMWVSGILFGAGHINVIKDGGFILSDVRHGVAYLLSLLIFLILVRAKMRNTRRGEKLYELSRSYPHMISDYCCSVGSVSIFALITYNIVASENPLISDFKLSLEMFLVVVNVLIFMGGYYGLKLAAQNEREESEGKVGKNK
ncbi:MAG: hypothetical protein ACN6I5_01530 [Hyphomicrobiales bacterium]